MHRAAMNIVQRCPFVQLTLADLSIDFADNVRPEGSIEEHHTIFERKIKSRFIIFWLSPTISGRGTNIIGRFISFRTCSAPHWFEYRNKVL